MWLKSRPRGKIVFRIVLLLVVSTFSAQVMFWQRSSIVYAGWRLFHYLSYGTRPLWDRPPKKLTLWLNHGNALPVKEMCERYGWKERSDTVKIFDVFIFSIELDLLELRIRELIDVVDEFIVLESDMMFTGNPKQAVFSDYLKDVKARNVTNRFGFAMHKVSHYTWHGNPHPKTPFENEAGLRGFADKILREKGIKRGDVFIGTDVDELPRREVVELYRKCEGMPWRLNMKMDNFLYSFAWRVDNEYLRPSMIQIFKSAGESKFTHAVITEDTLADAGWHCSWCFPTIAAFQFKMQAYSHADRHAVNKQTFLSPAHIQQSICHGTDLYDMMPEAFTFAKLLTMLNNNADRVLSLRELPVPLQTLQQFAWLRPGADCRRPLTDASSLPQQPYPASSLSVSSPQSHVPVSSAQPSHVHANVSSGQGTRL